MIGIILGLLSVIAFVVSIVLMIVILLQEPKGGGLAAALGGAGMEAVGVNTGSVNKFTATLATVWIVSCFLHAILMPVAHGVSAGPIDGVKPADNGDAPVLPPPPGDDGDTPPGDDGDK
jgi:preprotein translocase subunit SecG